LTRSANSGREQSQQSSPYSITSSARATSVGGMVRLKRLGRNQIHCEIEFGRLLDRNIDRLRPRRNLVNRLGSPLVQNSGS
jgi:hypothetical protein